MNEHDSFRFVPVEIADKVVGILVLIVLLFGTTPDVLGRFL